MNKKIAIALLASIVLLFNSCEWLEDVEVLTEATGSVVNAMSTGKSIANADDSSDTLEGATISFYKRQSDGLYDDGKPVTGTVNSSGDYSTSGGIGEGWFKVTGSKSGWTFVPLYVFITGNFAEIPPLSAYPNQAADTLVILLSWEDEDLDLDPVLTYYNGSGTRDYVGYIGSSSDIDALSNISVSAKNETDNNANIDISWPRDILSTTSSDVPRVETIVIEWNDNAPFLNESGTTNDVDNNQFNFYIRSYNKSVTGVDTGSSTDKPFSNAVVNIMYHSSATASGENYGVFDAPSNTAQELVKITDFTVTSSGGYSIPTAVKIRSISEVSTVIK